MMNVPSTTKVAIVVPNWNGADKLSKCLDSLISQSVPATIIVVDNGSYDNSVELIERDYPTVRLLKQSKNHGFAGGVNIGITSVLDHEFIALFNNDAVAKHDWIEQLLSSLEHDENIAISTSLFLNSDKKTIDSTGEQYSIWGLPFPRQRGLASELALSSGFTFGASGGASLYRTTALKKIGLFDSKFFAYYEDSDVSFRAQLNGYKVWYEKNAIAYHEQGATSRKIPGFTVVQTFKNLPLLLIRNVPKELLLTISGRFLVAYLLFFISAARKGNLFYAVKGIVGSITLLPHAIISRLEIQKEKTVTIDYLKSILWNDLPPDQTGIRKLRRIFKKDDNII